VARALATVVAVLGLAYACLWWSYERFYGQFDVSPQDVGLTPSGGASDLAGAALQLGVWLVIVVALLAALPVAAVAAIEAAVRLRRDQRSLVLAGAVAAVLLGLTAFLYWWLVDGWVGLTLFVAAAAVFGLLRLVEGIAASVFTPPRDRASGAGGPSEDAAAGQRTQRIALVVALAAAVIGMTFIDLPTDAAEAGRCAKTDKATRKSPASPTQLGVPELNLPLPGLRLPILNVHALPATLTWVAGSPPKGFILGKTVLYLGRTNGSVVVYDRTYREARSIPASSVEVSLTRRKSCPGVHG
jgi:hypothetical protein